MDQNSIKNLLAECLQMQESCGSLKPKQIISFATRCGYVLVKRGKEPTYKNVLWPNCPVITIPVHSRGRRAINKWTAKGILQQIEDALQSQLKY